MVDLEKLDEITGELEPFNATLVAVSKKKSVAEVLSVYNHGQLDFGENYVQELVAKHEELPKDVRWHFIGHLQTNKVKLIAPFVNIIHGGDSEKLIHEISRQAEKNNRTIDVLMQIHVAAEETKFGFSVNECRDFYSRYIMAPLPGIRIRGLMGMATFTNDEIVLKSEFKLLKSVFDDLAENSPGYFNILSMGMSSDYKLALKEGSTMVRIGSLIFGDR